MPGWMPAAVAKPRFDDLAPDDLAPDDLAPDDLAPDDLAPGSSPVSRKPA
jgi:multicomponent Na+:H+ antiporter subunit C